MYQPTVPICVGLWERKYGTVIGKTHWNLIHNLKEPKLMTLCWKIVHNIYPTNILLFKMKISFSADCKHCQNRDFIEHFFVHCKKVSKLWTEISKDICAYTGEKVTLDEEKILLGIPQIYGINKVSMDKINLAIAVGKLTISKFKYGKPRNLLEIYENESRLRKLWSR